MVVLTVLAMWFCGLSAVTSISRTIYALARDNGMPLARLWSAVGARHHTPGAAIWLSVALAFAALIYSGSYSVVTSLSVVGFYLSYLIPVFLGWRRKSQWAGKRGPWHLGASSNLGLALLWTLFICILMVMPPNTRAGAGIAGVMVLLFLLHRFSGPHDTRKPVWEMAEARPETLRWKQ